MAGREMGMAGKLITYLVSALPFLLQDRANLGSLAARGGHVTPAWLVRRKHGRGKLRNVPDRKGLAPLAFASWLLGRRA